MKAEQKISESEQDSRLISPCPSPLSLSIHPENKARGNQIRILKGVGRKVEWLGDLGKKDQQTSRVP